MGDGFNKLNRSVRKRLGKSERISKKKDFERIKRNGKRLNSKNYVIIFAKNDLPHNRIAIIISKKVGNAVVRNYEKRVCREIYRNIKDSLPVGFDLLIVVKNAASRRPKKRGLTGSSSSVEDSEFSERETELKRLFGRVN